MERLLSDQDILKIIGRRKSKIVTYPELSEYRTIEDLFGDKSIVIILFINEIIETATSRDVVGHWSVLSRMRRGKKTIIEFMDSYSLEPDEIKDQYNEDFLIETNQDQNILTELLYNFSLNDPTREVHYNEIPFQKQSENTATCGRWIAMRSKFIAVPLSKYQKVFQNMQAKGFDLDKLIVYLTDEMLDE